MEKLGHEFAKMEFPGRLAAVDRVGALQAQLSRKVGLLSVSEIRTPIQEKAFVTGIDLRAGNGFARLFQRLGKVLNDKIYVSAEYRWLRERFVKQHGIGGVCGDVSQFIQDAWWNVRDLKRFKDELAQTDYATAERERFGGCPNRGLEIPLTVYAQPVGASLGDLEDNDAKVVINLVYNRIGWQAARTCSNGGLEGSLAPSRLGGWLAESFAPKIPVAVSVSADSSFLQAFPRCLPLDLVLDGEVSAGDLILDDLVLAHNAETHLLELATREGVSIKTNYLGGALPSAAWGPRYFVLLLGEPFAIGRPSRVQLSASDTGEVRYQERLEEHGCILLRATWWMPAVGLAKRFAKAPPWELLLRAEEMRTEHGMPRYLYVEGEYSSWNASSFGVKSKSKPIWCDLENIFCLNQLLSLAKRTDSLKMREALPGPGEHVLQIGGKRHVSEFMFECVLYGRNDAP